VAEQGELGRLGRLGKRNKLSGFSKVLVAKSTIFSLFSPSYPRFPCSFHDDFRKSRCSRLIVNLFTAHFLFVTGLLKSVDIAQKNKTAIAVLKN
jgi:hypothetical protein